MYTRWNTYSSYLKKRHGKSLYRIGVDGGFSCPNRRADKSGGCAFCDGTGSVAVYQRKAESGYRRLSAYDDNVASGIMKPIVSVREQIENLLHSASSHIRTHMTAWRISDVFMMRRFL